MEYSRQELNTALEGWQFQNVDLCMNKDAVFLLQQGSGKALKTMSKKAIYDIAKGLEIKGRSKMTKEELIEAVRKASKSKNRNNKKLSSNKK